MTDPMDAAENAAPHGRHVTPLERVEQLVATGQLRICRQSKPLTERDALVLLEFHDALAAGAYRKTDQHQPDQEER